MSSIPGEGVANASEGVGSGHHNDPCVCVKIRRPTDCTLGRNPPIKGGGAVDQSDSHSWTNLKCVDKFVIHKGSRESAGKFLNILDLIKSRRKRGALPLVRMVTLRF